MAGPDYVVYTIHRLIAYWGPFTGLPMCHALNCNGFGGGNERNPGLFNKWSSLAFEMGKDDGSATQTRILSPVWEKSRRNRMKSIMLKKFRFCGVCWKLRENGCKHACDWHNNWKKRVQNVKQILLVKEWKRNRNNQTVTIFNSEMISLLFLFGASTISLHLGYQSNTLVKHSDTSWMLCSKRSGCKQWLSFYHITDWIK